MVVLDQRNLEGGVGVKGDYVVRQGVEKTRGRKTSREGRGADSVLSPNKKYEEHRRGLSVCPSVCPWVRSPNRHSFFLCPSIGS